MGSGVRYGAIPGQMLLALSSFAMEPASAGYDVLVAGGDYQSGRIWDDSVCHSFYPIDLHVIAGGDRAGFVAEAAH